MVSMFSAVRRLAAVSLLSAAFPSVALAEDLPARGQVDVKVVPGPDGASRVVARAVLDVAPKKVWAIVSDCAHYKDHMPRVEASELLKKEGNVYTCKVTLNMPFPLSNLTAVTEAVHEESDKKRVRRWHLVSGDYKVNEGSWEVSPADDSGTSSLVVYSVRAEPNSAVPESLRQAAQKKELPKMIERVKSEASKLP